MILGDPLNCSQFELRNGVLHLLASAPSTPVVGQFFYLTGTNVGYVFNGSKGRPMDAAALSDGSIPNAALAPIANTLLITNPLLRSNHTGTQFANTISNLQTTVTGYTLDTFAQPINTMNFGTQRLSNIAPATNSSDAARWDQVQAYVQASVQGQTAIKNPVRFYAATNVNISAPGATLDGMSANVGDRVLLGSQTTATQNGIYVFNGSASAMTLATDAASGLAWIEGTEVLVTEGTVYAGAVFRQTTSGTIVLGTTPLAFTQTFKINTYSPDGVTTSLTGYTFAVKYGYGFSTASGSLGVDTTKIPSKFSYTITCDGASSAFNVTHNLGTTDVIVGVRDSAGNKVFVDDNPASSAMVTISFGAIPPQNTTYRVTVIG